jgi:hypothetical protein
MYIVVLLLLRNVVVAGGEIQGDQIGRNGFFFPFWTVFLKITDMAQIWGG